MSTHKSSTVILSLLLYCILIIFVTSTRANQLTCFCNECEQDTCNTTNHPDSVCFKSVERVLEDGAYQLAPRFGCISGADSSLATLQCHVNTKKHIDLRHMSCCKENFCNQDLRDPDPTDDPRWAERPPLDIIVILTAAILFILFIGMCTFCYVISRIIFIKYRNKPEPAISTESQDSICSFKVDFDQLKSPYLNHDIHHHPHLGSSTASSRTYSESDYLSQKPDPSRDDDTSTLPDFTSGAGPGARELKVRTMAQGIKAGGLTEIGRGRYGCVYRGIYQLDDIAVKAFKSIDVESQMKEQKILSRLNHENVIRCFASETVEIGGGVTEIWMFLEYCPYGSLCDFLANHEICGPQQAVKILYSIIKGLAYLHSDFSQSGASFKPSIAHRDLKSKNILMRTLDTCCIADFGHSIAKINDNTIDFGGDSRVQVGTIRYMAPEILQPTFENFLPNQFYSYAQADMYQFGLIMWEIANRTALDVLQPSGSHKLPYDGTVPQNPTIDDMIKIVCEDNYRPPIAEHWIRHPWMARIVDLMGECWRRKPVARPEALGAKIELKKLFDSIRPQPSITY